MSIRELLEALENLGYQTSAKKSPDLPKESDIPWLHPYTRSKMLLSDKKKDSDKDHFPTIQRTVRELLGMAGVCCLWIPSFAEHGQVSTRNTERMAASKWAMIHCPGHQKANTLVVQGKRLADLKSEKLL